MSGKIRLYVDQPLGPGQSVPLSRDQAHYLFGVMRQGVGAEVLLFPEWSQREAPDEYLRINRVHQSIAKQTESPIAPIGQTWAAVQQEFPKLQLHDDDGNHASFIGHWLNACIFYGMIAEEPVGEKQRLPIPGLSANQQDALPKHAWEEVQRGVADESKSPQSDKELP